MYDGNHIISSYPPDVHAKQVLLATKNLQVPTVGEISYNDRGPRAFGEKLRLH